MNSLQIAATGMQAQQLNVETISHNIANMRTTGFKKLRAEFQDLLYQDLRQAGSSSSQSGTEVPTGVQIGYGVKTGATSRVMSQGTMTRTDKELDVGVNGKDCSSSLCRTDRPLIPGTDPSRGILMGCWLHLMVTPSRPILRSLKLQEISR